MSLRRFKPVKNKWRIAAITALTVAMLSFAIAEVETRLKTGSWGKLYGFFGPNDPYPEKTTSQALRDLKTHLNLYDLQGSTSQVIWELDDCKIQDIVLRSRSQCSTNSFWRTENYLNLRMANIREVKALSRVTDRGEVFIEIPFRSQYLKPLRRIWAAHGEMLTHRIKTEKTYDLVARFAALNAAVADDPDIDLLTHIGESTSYCGIGEITSPPSLPTKFSFLFPKEHASEAVKLIQSYAIKACME
ncbi:MAG: hypothetical protein ACPGGK_09080 [Pikeienuella sp.]